MAQHPEPTGIFDDPVEGGDGQLQETTVSVGANPALGLPGPTTHSRRVATVCLEVSNTRPWSGFDRVAYSGSLF